MTRLRSCIFVGALFAALPGSAAFNPRALAYSTDQAAAPPLVTPLETGVVIEHQLSRGEEHRYQLWLAGGDYASVIVEQRGIDVVVQASAPGDGPIADFQDEVRNRGEERIAVVADVTGIYTLAIKPAPGIVVPGGYAIRVASRRRATAADRAMQESRKLRTAGVRLEQAGKFDEARSVFERALRIAEEVQGPDDTSVTALVWALATNALEVRDGARAQSLYQRVLTALEKTWGADHPATALVQARLALFIERAGQRSKAEAVLKQSLAVIERSLGTEHLWYVRCLVTLGTFRDNAGDLDEAEEIEQRGLRILEKLQETDSILYANLLNNLGELNRQREKFAVAEDLFRRSLAIGERLRGSDSYWVGTTLQNLGSVARERKDYAMAEAYYTRALAIRERTVGPEHPDIAQLLNNLAVVYHSTGDDTRSLEMHFRALSIWEKTAGPYQRGTLLSVGNIARTYAASGDVAKAIAFQRRADAIVETQLALNLAAGSERQKLANVTVAAERTDRTISLNLGQAPGNPDATALAALVLLQRKGRVLDAMTDTFAAVRQRVPDMRDRALLDQLRTTTADLARLALSQPDETRQEGRPTSIKDLEARKERIEAELSEHSAEFRAEMQPVTLEAVAAAIPDDAALLEFAVYRPFDPRAVRNVEAYGPPHYAAYVLRKHAPPRGLDLGPVSEIDEAIDALRRALRDPGRTDLQARAREVDEQVVMPLRRWLGDATRLLISPDGDLNLVPFEALVDEHGRYLIERYAMSYLTSGRDLLRMHVTHTTRSEPVIFADPLFGEPIATGNEQQTRNVTARPGQSVATSDDLSTAYFAPLAGTAEEARAIKALFPEATLLTGRQATKASLQQLEAPRMLHVASHGFFLQDSAVDTAQAPGRSVSGTSGTAPSPKLGNPLLRSGLALAGANTTHGPHADGILTALEASGLNLWGTKLVTLSACDSGVGEVRNGEGVYGLRRAFVLAGTETMVMSLWPVSDYIARETMVAYYTGLRNGLGRGDALRQAKLALLKRKGRQHPFYWASFIQSGEWASLDGVR